MPEKVVNLYQIISFEGMTVATKIIYVTEDI